MGDGIKENHKLCLFIWVLLFIGGLLRCLTQFLKAESFAGRGSKWLSSSDPDAETLFWHSFWHTIWKYILDLYSDILSDLLSGIYSDILSGVLSGNYSDIELRAPDLSRHCPLRSGARGWDPAVQEKEEKDEEEKATLIKSRDPHLAGGKYVDVCWCILIDWLPDWQDRYTLWLFNVAIENHHY